MRIAELNPAQQVVVLQQNLDGLFEKRRLALERREEALRRVNDSNPARGYCDPRSRQTYPGAVSALDRIDQEIADLDLSMKQTRSALDKARAERSKVGGTAGMSPEARAAIEQHYADLDAVDHSMAATMELVRKAYRSGRLIPGLVAMHVEGRVQDRRASQIGDRARRLFELEAFRERLEAAMARHFEVEPGKQGQLGDYVFLRVHNMHSKDPAYRRDLVAFARSFMDEMIEENVL